MCPIAQHPPLALSSTQFCVFVGLGNGEFKSCLQNKSKLSKRKFHLCFAKCMVFTRISTNITQYEWISLVLMLLSNFKGFNNVYVIFFVPFFFLFHLDAFLHFILFFFEICVLKCFEFKVRWKMKMLNKMTYFFILLTLMNLWIMFCIWKIFAN